MSSQLFFKRLLSIFVDGFLAKAIFFAIPVPPKYFDYAFVPAFVFMAVYFTVGYSSITDGRTIGKKMFGLSVKTVDGQYLTLKQSFFRFCLSYGLIAAIQELPGFIFRAFQTSASAYVLQFNTGIWLAYISACLAGVFVDGRAIHDVVAKTRVETDELKITPDKKYIHKVLLGAIFGLIIWLPGVQSGFLNENKYIIEETCNVRIMQVLPGQPLEIFAHFIGKNQDAQCIVDFIRQENPDLDIKINYFKNEREPVTETFK